MTTEPIDRPVNVNMQPPEALDGSAYRIPHGQPRSGRSVDPVPRADGPSAPGNPLAAALQRRVAEQTAAAVEVDRRGTHRTDQPPTKETPMASDPQISDEMVREFNRVFNEVTDRDGDDDPNAAARAGLAAALAASGWRREADVLREAAASVGRHADSYEIVAKQSVQRLKGRTSDADLIRQRQRLERRYVRGLLAAMDDLYELAEEAEKRTQASALDSSPAPVVASECVTDRRADGEPLPPTCCGGWIGEHGEGPILCDPCPPAPVAESKTETDGGRVDG